MASDGGRVWEAVVGAASPSTAGALAAIDCGTNSTRLLVTDTEGQTLRRLMRVTRLGQGVDATGRLAPSAIDRTVAVLREYRQVMEQHGVGRARLVATSAARDAANAADFFAAAEQVTGVAPELLSGLEEGQLSFAGATARLPEGIGRDEPVLVCDIGGGSTELVVGRPDRREAVAACSLDVGCVRLTERHLVGDPPTAGELAEARAAVTGPVAQARRDLPDLAGDGPVVGLAGTVSTLASLAQGVAGYDRRRVHHAVLRRSEVEHWLSELAERPASGRMDLPGMVEGRQDVIVGGALVLAMVMEVFERATCLVSEDDILDGLVASLR